MLTLIRRPFHPRVATAARNKTPVILPKVQVADYTLTREHPRPKISRSGLTMLSRLSVEICQGNELTHNSSRNNTLPE